jgi:hypothetical protein
MSKTMKQICRRNLILLASSLGCSLAKSAEGKHFGNNTQHFQVYLSLYFQISAICIGF